MDERSKSTETTAATTLTNVTETEKFSTSLMEVFKPEIRKMWYGSSVVKDMFEVIIGVVLSSITGIGCFFLFKFIRNNKECKVC
jgi:hypothetical protein